jgi:hypothetical protein
MLRTEARIGQDVVVNHPSYPGIWVVDKINPKNLKLRHKAGGRALNCPPSYCEPYDADKHGDEGTAKSDAPKQFSAFFEKGETLGTLIRFADRDGLYVITGTSYRNGTETAQAALVGGDGGRYITRIRPGLGYEIVDPADVLK